MQKLEDVLREHGCPQEPADIVKLARRFHRVGIKRRKALTPYWQKNGLELCALARDLVTFAQEIKKQRAAPFMSHGHAMHHISKFYHGEDYAALILREREVADALLAFSFLVRDDRGILWQP